MSVDKLKTKLAVIGAGPGGYAAAFRAADLGMQVLLIDGEVNPGGVCLYRGCIPSKALLHAAHVISQAEEAKKWGIEFSFPRINILKLQEWKDSIIQKLTGGLGQMVKQRKVTYLQGQARFIDSHQLEVAQVHGGQVHVSFDEAIIATGSRPVVFESWPLDSPHLLNSTDALNFREIPKNMLVVGGGYIGLEMGTVYAALGTKITVVEMMPSILPGVDIDLVRPLKKRLDQNFSKILLEAKVTEVTQTPMGQASKGLKVMILGKEGEVEEIFEKVLVSVGRKPNSSGLGLQSTQVKVNEKGHIVVNKQLKTAEDSIYAIGDVVGEPMLAHKASHEARVAVESIHGKSVAFEPMAIPAVIFTDPEIAWCGLTEEQAKKEGRVFEVSRFPWVASGRSLTLDRNEGFTKLIIDPADETILGVGIVGPGAGELIAEGVLAIEMGATASDLALCIHPHPTLSETLMEAAEVFFGQSTHLYRPKKKY